MGGLSEFFKYVVRMITDKFKDSKAFRVISVGVAVVLLFVGFVVLYPDAREGFAVLSNDLAGAEEEPQFLEVAYDEATHTVKGSVGPLSNPEKYKLVLFILTDQWYVKPVYDDSRGLYDLQNDRFILNAYSPDQYENDIAATQYAVFLVPASYGGPEHMNDYDGAMNACLDSYLDTIP